MELEESGINFNPQPDPRRKVPEPLPVRLIAVGDAVSHAIAGREREMDEFYVSMLGFVRAAPAPDPDARTAAVIVYRADNFDLRLDVREPLFHRDDLRPIQVEVLSLAELELKLVEREIEFTRQRGLSPGQESLVLQDPSGNWLEIIERRIIH